MPMGKIYKSKYHKRLYLALGSYLFFGVLKGDLLERELIIVGGGGFFLTPDKDVQMVFCILSALVPLKNQF